MTRNDEYARKILEILIYIENNLDQPLETEDLAKKAFYSTFHFHRLFRTFTGQSVQAYIKKIRLDRAAAQLCYSDTMITKIALDASYETPSSFAKAFALFKGKSPRNYRTIFKNMYQKEKKIKELHMIKPDSIEEISNQNLYFIRRCGNYAKSSSSAWDSMLSIIGKKQLDKSQLRYFGIAYDDPKVVSEENLRYDAAIASKKPLSLIEDLGNQTVKGGKVAVFTHKGAYKNLEETFSNIFFKWLPQSEEALDEKRQILSEFLNLEYKEKDPAKLITKIYIPLK